MSDRQCSSCGGFCGRGGCKRENVKPPTRKPLTDEQIDAEFDRETWVTVVFADGTRGIALDRVTARDFARAIERAHGIGSEE